ncbi:helix-turn-helix domain-containing protein [Nocardia sp. NPDC051981]|uniref:terminase gpP N-terminus-related DNA-binding protein n=1 Tax=Nocardia sp. NPDC051981 TaxID=3155417 RepID=UPI0034241162
MTKRTDKPRGHRVAQAGFVFGSLTSVATNVLHTYLPTVHMPSGLALVIAARIGSAVWPLGLLLSIEVLARVAWRRGRGWALARFGGAGTVAFGSAVISYSHVRDVLLAWGYGHPAAEFGPLTLDGLMVVCGFALLSLNPSEGDAPQIQARVNAAEVRPVRVLSSSSPAAREIPLTAQIEAIGEPVRPAPASVATVSGQAAKGADSTEDSETDSRRQRARELHAQNWSHGRIASELGVSKRTVRRYVSPGADTDLATGGHADSSEDTAVPADTASPLPAEWLSGIDTNHHDNHEGVLA